jgi:hypothetical protein
LPSHIPDDPHFYSCPGSLPLIPSFGALFQRDAAGLRTARGTGPPDTVSHPRPLLLLLTKSGINSVCSLSHLHAHRDRNGWSPDQVQYIQSDAPYRNYTTRFHPSNCILSALAMPIMEDRGIGLRPPVRHRLTGWEHCAERSSVLCRREHEGWTHTAFLCCFSVRLCSKYQLNTRRPRAHRCWRLASKLLQPCLIEITADAEAKRRSQWRGTAGIEPSR